MKPSPSSIPVFPILHPPPSSLSPLISTSPCPHFQTETQNPTERTISSCTFATKPITRSREPFPSYFSPIFIFFPANHTPIYDLSPTYLKAFVSSAIDPFCSGSSGSAGHPSQLFALISGSPRAVACLKQGVTQISESAKAVGRPNQGVTLISGKPRSVGYSKHWVAPNSGSPKLLGDPD